MVGINLSEHFDINDIEFTEEELDIGRTAMYGKLVNKDFLFDGITITNVPCLEDPLNKYDENLFDGNTLELVYILVRKAKEQNITKIDFVNN